MTKFVLLPLLAVLVLSSHLASAGEQLQAEPIHFGRQVRPILSENCFACHGPDDKKREAKLRLDVEDSAKGLRDGAAAIVPGQPEKSLILARIQATDPDEVMPPPRLHKTVTLEQRAILRAWIQQGAPWGKHWSYETVVRPAVSKGELGGSPNSEIDAFLAARLARENLRFSPEAEPATLVRRLALDLTGLPPTLAELQQFALLPPGNFNYEAAIDYYLAKPAYGEHWTRLWLDLARYADSSGYPSETAREIWAYRDWVIRAINANMPFDQFTIEQIAGDLLPNPTDDQLVATAFHRNTMTQNEGGTSDEEFRNAAVVDRVNTTMAVWMGTSMACAQCHSHKYDSITNKEFFEFFAILNQTADSDKRDEVPLHDLWEAGQKEHLAELKAQLAAAEAPFNMPPEAWLVGLADWTKAEHPELEKMKTKPASLIKALASEEEKRTPAELKEIRDYYVRNVAPENKAERKALEALQKKVAAVKPTTVPVMKELTGKDRRVTKIQRRGNYLDLGDVVGEGVPAAFHPLPADAPRNRLTLARWLVDRNNPLTARVTVNRYWEALFGVGIVRTSEEFGSQGELPIHGELLDWLAAEFMDSGWDVKHMLRLMVMSRAYRQTSKVTPELQERDPENRFLARGPRFRPTGELLRDESLAVSGLLSPKMLGPSVRPLAPKLNLNTAFGRANDWATSEGDDKHRRSVYTEIRRNNPYPAFSTFDAPNREVCTLRRSRTNTPLQAFVTLNDPVFVETAQALARRIVKEGGDDSAARLQWTYRVCLSRSPNEKELQRLQTLLDDAKSQMAGETEQATKLATDPLGPAPAGSDVVELAAWTVVANVVLNLDEFVMRR